MRKSRAYTSKNSNSGIRSSIASKFFLKRSDNLMDRPQTAESSSSDKQQIKKSNTTQEKSEQME